MPTASHMWRRAARQVTCSGPQRAEGTDRRPKRPDERKEEMWEGWMAALASEEEMETEDGTMNFGTGRWM